MPSLVFSVILSTMSLIGFSALSPDIQTHPSDTFGSIKEYRFRGTSGQGIAQWQVFFHLYKTSLSSYDELIRDLYSTPDYSTVVGWVLLRSTNFERIYPVVGIKSAKEISLRHDLPAMREGIKNEDAKIIQSCRENQLGFKVKFDESSAIQDLFLGCLGDIQDRKAMEDLKNEENFEIKAPVEGQSPWPFQSLRSDSFGGMIDGDNTAYDIRFVSYQLTDVDRKRSTTLVPTQSVSILSLSSSAKRLAESKSPHPKLSLYRFLKLMAAMDKEPHGTGLSSIDYLKSQTGSDFSKNTSRWVGVALTGPDILEIAEYYFGSWEVAVPNTCHLPKLVHRSLIRFSEGSSEQLFGYQLDELTIIRPLHFELRSNTLYKKMARGWPAEVELH